MYIHTILFGLSIGVALGGLFSFLRSKTEQEPEQPNLDQLVLDQLAKAGSNLQKPHQIDFFLYFSAQNLAENAAQLIREEGASVEVKLSASGNEFLCETQKEMIPDLGELMRLRERFNQIAHEYGGEYDGWGAAIVD